ncbi:MAG: hypothetical protein JWM71_180 [Solirubrobacteraceae bacterium]|nr:hypothetical protein [Solirubrobacteraceae bacterium]
MAVIAAMVALAQFLPGTSSSFTDTTGDSGNTVSAAADWTAPTVSATVLQKSIGGLTGKIGQGDTFYIYANVADTGNPASGVSTVTASTANIATASTATLTAGSYTVGGTTYDHRTALLTAKATLATGTYSYTINATDFAGNGPATLAGSVSVDNSAFAGADYTWSDTGTTGRYTPGDTIGFTYTSTVDPSSIVSGWDGSATTVTVGMYDSAVYGTSSDILAVGNSAGTVQLPLGTVTLNGDYVVASKGVVYGGSTMTASGNTISITLGTWDNSANARTATVFGLPDWAPSASAFDAFGNPSSTSSVSTFGGTSFVATNKSGGTAGKAEAGDSVSYAYSKAPLPSSILSGWSGSSTSVTVRLTDHTTAGTTSDTISVLTAGGASIPLGSVLTGGDYVTAGTLDFTGSTMVLTGSTVKITLGTAGGGTTHTDTAGHKPTWTPDSGATDAFGAGAANFAVVAAANVTGF